MGCLMAIKEVNYDIIQGDTWSVDIYVKDPSAVLVDFTGYTFIMEVRDKEGGNVLCATATLGNGITYNDTTKVVSVELTPAQTNKFNLPKSKYQILSIDGSLRRKTLVQGWFQVKANTIQ